MPDLFEDSKSSDSYSAQQIEILEGLEPVRHRPGMYVGGTDKTAMHHLVAELFDNSMDEAVAGYANWIEITLIDKNNVKISDNGRGIPIDPHPKFPNKSALEVILTMLHAGGKFSGKVYETSGGLHGVGASVVNALSVRLDAEIVRDKKLYNYKGTLVTGNHLVFHNNMWKRVHDTECEKINMNTDEGLYLAS